MNRVETGSKVNPRHWKHQRTLRVALELCTEIISLCSLHAFFTYSGFSAFPTDGIPFCIQMQHNRGGQVHKRIVVPNPLVSKRWVSLLSFWKEQKSIYLRLLNSLAIVSSLLLGWLLTPWVGLLQFYSCPLPLVNRLNPKDHCFLQGPPLRRTWLTWWWLRSVTIQCHGQERAGYPNTSSIGQGAASVSRSPVEQPWGPEVDPQHPSTDTNNCTISCSLGGRDRRIPGACPSTSHSNLIGKRQVCWETSPQTMKGEWDWRSTSVDYRPSHAQAPPPPHTHLHTTALLR